MGTTLEHERQAVAPVIEASIEIAATPQAVWAVLTDPKAMSRLSPQVLASFVVGGAGPGGGLALGARTLNINRDRWLVWPTRAKVVSFDAPSDYAFKIAENRAVWRFLLTPTDAGTRVVQRREAPKGLSDPSLRLTKAVLGGQTGFTAILQRGMDATLARLKESVESA